MTGRRLELLCHAAGEGESDEKIISSALAMATGI